MSNMYLQTDVDARIDALKVAIRGATTTAAKDMGSIADALINARTLHRQRVESINKLREEADDELHAAIEEAINAAMTIRKGMSSKPVEPEAKGEPLKEPQPDNVLQIAAE